MINFHDDEPGPDREPTEDDLTFLRDEGLDLLSSYRKINDLSKRKQVMKLIASMIAEQESITSNDVSK